MFPGVVVPVSRRGRREMRRGAAGAAPERDDVSSSRHRALLLSLSMIFSENR